MGCGLSTVEENDENDGSKFDFTRRNTIVEKPHVLVEIGKGVKKISPEERIVFIFGKVTLLLFSLRQKAFGINVSYVYGLQEVVDIQQAELLKM